ncbi:MAG: tRNA dihydrouridine(20/20a) synthase DusA [Rhodospirillaceae bacterium]|nr:tRNA dihydrouridine(20/20a) synthase DusA [Rhodospirillaceae bacterium]
MTLPAPNQRLSIAPMMDCTDRHFRYLVRLMTRHALLYTEMVTANALVRGRDPQRFIAYADVEHPVALQLGGADPALMAEAAAKGAAAGYDEINLNIGCPSDRVSAGRFGACLMAEPKLVAEMVHAINARLAAHSRPIPVTVKTRIGIDHQDSEAFLDDFVGAVSAAGCATFIIHARKAWLSGLSPKENREIPPLIYARAYKLKRDFPQFTIAINGGIKDLGAAAEHLNHVDGVMIGRAAYDAPYALLAQADVQLFGDTHTVLTEAEIALAYLEYAGRELAQGVKLHAVTRHAMGLFTGRPGARVWRRALAEVNGNPEPAEALKGLRALVTRNVNDLTLNLREELAA